MKKQAFRVSSLKDPNPKNGFRNEQIDNRVLSKFEAHPNTEEVKQR